MDTPVLLIINIKSSLNSTGIRSIVLKEYFSQLTSNVEVLYPTQILSGLLLCKSRRTEEKILNMRHTLSNGSIIHLSHLPTQLFQQTKCTIDSQIKGLVTYLQQCLPFLYASGGKIQINSDGSILLEGHIYVLNSIHSYLAHKTSKSHQSNPSEPLDLRSGNLTVKIMNGKLLEQNVDSIIIPISDKYKVHKSIDRQIQSFGGINLSNYFKDLTTKGTRIREGNSIIYPNRDLKIPAKTLIIFVVPRISNKDKSTINSYQPAYEQFIYRMLQTVDQNSITSLAMPVLEPSVKTAHERRPANEMTVRAMVSAFRQFSQNPLIKLKRIIVVDHQVQIKRINKRVKTYQNQNQIQTKSTNNNNIDFDKDDGHSFDNIFGVPKSHENVSSSSESDDDVEGEEYQLPYTDHAKS
ncbi:unnamed protein product [Adineta steineri]|uniref:Macro domain-containing protein n=2 Tax=Adineta steineri TaxID=433720 RepID=A0A813YZ54_9BILA|nr:unnamed protein product [Adineta steineri]CAF0891218.1 unnamed protein product [Adineta steineri]